MIHLFNHGGMTEHLAHKLLPLATAITLLIAILAPVTYWDLAHRNLRNTANLYAEDLAQQIQQVALDSPALWKYQTYKFMSLTEGFHPNIAVSGFRILDEKGEIITGHDYQNIFWGAPGQPLSLREDLRVSQGSAPIFFNAKKVGTVEVLADDLPIVQTSAVLFGFSSLLGLILALLAFQIPIRVVRKMEGEIDHLISNLRASDEHVRNLNAELELKVAERTRELMAAQEKLLRKEKLAILGQLSGSVGHELRNPLGVMSNAVYFLKMINSDEKTRQYLDIIKHEIDNSLRIITDLLDFARTKPPQTMSVTTRQLLDGSLNKCAIPENVDLQIDLPESLPPLRIDPQQMEQVFQNLMTNAVQAMPKGGCLHVSARHHASFDDEFVAISVTDTGEGISPESMEKLFQPLFTTKARGIGLGLVVCKNLVEANSGRIAVETELGVGTTFTVYLPAGE